MAAEGRRPSASVVQQLLQAGYRFEFFQAVRVLQQYFAIVPDSPETQASSREPLIGTDTDPDAEPVRFHVAHAAGFPPASIRSVQARHRGGEDSAEEAEAPLKRPLDMVVNFIGLTGPNGVLPQHFTTLMIERQRANDPCLSAFQDLFNHRITSMFYRAWEKYRFPIRYERQRRAGQSVAGDPFTCVLLGLVGLAEPSLQNRQSFDDEAWLYYSGHLSHRVRNATSLEDMLCEFFGAPTRVVQFVGQWLEIGPEACSAVPTAERPEGRNAELGRRFTIGERVWDIASRLRISIGPLRLREYLRLLPCGDGFRPLGHLVRTYVGPPFDLDVQLILRADEIPRTLLESGGLPPQLGWTTFLLSEPAREDYRDAIFSLQEF